MDSHDDASTTPVVRETEAEINQLIGMFDAPAFVRRGHDLEYALARIDQKLRRHRDGMLDMVRLRLKQWSAAATGPLDIAGAFLSPLTDLHAAGPFPPTPWATDPAPARRRRALARDLAASVARFNTRWSEFLAKLSVDHVNTQIEHYNRYYVLEKECVLGSARLAARHFRPKPLLTPERLLAEYPLLPVPELVG